MEGFTRPSDTERELGELRRRAYGRNPDIGVDATALARLRELEEAHRAAVRSRADAPARDSGAGTDAAPTVAPTAAASARDRETPEQAGSTDAAPPAEEGALRSLLRRAMATWRSRVVWTVGALVVVGGIVATVVLVSTRPDATLPLTAATADGQVRRLVTEEAPWFEIDTSTPHAHGSYLGLEIWSGLNAFDSPCLVAVYRATDTLSDSRCAPSAAELIMDVSSSGDGFEGFPGRPGEGIVRFILRGDTVDAYVHLVPEAG